MKNHAPVISSVIVTVIAYLSYFHGYAEPAAFFWDENYHIAQAQKYLHGVFFMELHPPLGKLLIALGEWLLHPNAATDQYLKVSYASELPAGFSFAGYRLFPALCGMFAAPLFAYAMRLITGRWLWGVLLSSLYLFDNAVIVHSRGAMLESVQIFFLLLGIAAALRLITDPSSVGTWKGILFGSALGIGLGGAIATKSNALVALLLIPYVMMALREAKRRAAPTIVSCGVALVAVYGSVWGVHFELARTVEAQLPDNGYFTPAPEVREVVSRGYSGSLHDFSILYRGALAFAARYGKGVPTLNLCKADENGSHPLMWPLGGRSINYRWERKGEVTSYLYLQSNPAVWMIGLVGIVGAISLLFTSAWVGTARPLQRPALLRLFVIMYLSYMMVMVMIERVMYLYHYFIPLLLSLLLFGMVLDELVHARRVRKARITGALLLLATAVVGCFLYFSPLTYAKPLTDTEVTHRSWVRLWDLRCATCGPHNGIAVPRCDWQVKVGASSSVR